jgi:hypothetical protein
MNVKPSKIWTRTTYFQTGRKENLPIDKRKRREKGKKKNRFMRR